MPQDACVADGRGAQPYNASTRSPRAVPLRPEQFQAGSGILPCRSVGGIANEGLARPVGSFVRWSNEPELVLRGMAADLSWMRERYEELRSQGLD